MKSKQMRPLLLATLWVATSLACSAVTQIGSGGQPTVLPPTSVSAAPSATSVFPTSVAPTQVRPPTEAAPPTAETPSATPASLQFFTEEFDGGLDDWNLFITSGHLDEVGFFVENGNLVFDMGEKQLWAYAVYAPQTYDNVRIDARAENRGDNTNNISIICRYDEEDGWYEFNMYNSGLYNILYGYWNSARTSANYILIADGGSNAIKQGLAVNDYSVICNDNVLTLFINGDEARSVSENLHALNRGLIGIGVSSFNRLPVRVEYESVKISEP